MNPQILIVSIVMLAVGLGGCVDNDAPLDDDEATPPSQPQAGLGPASNLPSVVDREAAEPTAPPTWAVGEWWRYEYVDTLFAQQWEVTLVVAGWDGESYLVGQPLESFEDRGLIMHLPHAGEINPATLGFLTHGVPFEPLQFPLVPGDSWSTHIHGGVALDAVVDDVQGPVATVELAGAMPMTITYDATVGTITHVDMGSNGHYTLLDHGFGYEGKVRVPAAQELSFCHGRAVVVAAMRMCSLPLLPPDPAPPVEILPVTSDLDRLSLGLMVFDMVPSPAGTGSYAIHLTAPDGSMYESVATSPLPTAVGAFYGVESPVGDWLMVAAAAGAGAIMAEGIGYQVLDVNMPSGCIFGDRVPALADSC